MQVLFQSEAVLICIGFRKCNPRIMLNHSLTWCTLCTVRPMLAHCAQGADITPVGDMKVNYAAGWVSRKHARRQVTGYKQPKDSCRVVGYRLSGNDS